MDFHTLSRKDLQALCKTNKIPANITNVAMADSLAALDHVEGLEEILNSREVDAGTPNVRTAVKASTQRKAAREEVEGPKVPVPVSVSKRPQRGARAAEGVVEQENNKDANVLVTPAPSRRRATAVSTRRKKEVEMVEEDADKNGVQDKPPAVPNTPAAAAPVSTRATGRSVRTGGTSVQRAYSTRRSVRLLGKDLSKMSLVDTEENGPVKIDNVVSQDLSNMSLQVEELSDTEKGSSLQAASTVVSEDTVSVGLEYQSHDSGSDLKLDSVTEIDMVVESHVSNEAEPQKVKCLELDAELHASNEGSELLEESGDSSEVDTLPVVASDTADVTVVVHDVDVNVQVSNDGDDQEDKDEDVNDASVNLKELVEEGVGKEGFKVESTVVTQDSLLFEASEDAVMEVTDTPSNTQELEAETEKIEDASDVTTEDNEETSENLKAEAKESMEPVEADARTEEFEEPAEDDLVETDQAFSSDAVSEDSVHEQKSTDLLVQLVVSDQLKGDVRNFSMMKENATNDELVNKSMGQLKRMLKDLTLGGKSNHKTNDLKEVEKKRTALQQLPQNQITGDEAQIDS